MDRASSTTQINLMRVPQISEKNTVLAPTRVHVIPELHTTLIMSLRVLYAYRLGDQLWLKAVNEASLTM